MNTLTATQLLPGTTLRRVAQDRDVIVTGNNGSLIEYGWVGTDGLMFTGRITTEALQKALTDGKVTVVDTPAPTAIEVLAAQTGLPADKVATILNRALRATRNYETLDYAQFTDQPNPTEAYTREWNDRFGRRSEIMHLLADLGFGRFQALINLATDSVNATTWDDQDDYAARIVEAGA